jgi:hypothetical protein
VLQGMKAERGDRGGIRVAVDAEDAAFLAQRIAVEIEIEAGAFTRTGRLGRPRNRVGLGGP